MAVIRDIQFRRIDRQRRLPAACHDTEVDWGRIHHPIAIVVGARRDGESAGEISVPRDLVRRGRVRADQCRRGDSEHIARLVKFHALNRAVGISRVCGEKRTAADDDVCIVGRGSNLNSRGHIRRRRNTKCARLAVG